MPRLADDLEISVIHCQFSKSQNTSLVIEVASGFIGRAEDSRHPGAVRQYDSIALNVNSGHLTVYARRREHSIRVQNNVVTFNGYASILFEIDELGKIFSE